MNLDVLIGVVIALVVIGIVSVVGLELLEDTAAEEVTGLAGCNSTAKTSCSAAYNGSQDAITGVSKVPAKLPMIVTAVVGALVISILLTYLYFKR